MSQQTVTINGVEYDTHTGMPVQKTASREQAKAAPILPQSEVHHSHSMHRPTQKSKTLNRRVVKKTAASQPRSSAQKSPAITKFAPHPSGAKPQKARVSDIGPTNHPAAAKAHQQMQAAAKKPAQPKPAQTIKQEAITEALKKAPSHTANNKQLKKKHPRMLGLASAGLALLLLGGYFTYLNMPSLSVRVAAAQAGVNASYPEYHPDGYSLNGPVAYTEGQVTMKFAANGGPHNFTITQSKSNWDSSALEENYVSKESNDGYVPYIEHGLKIYVFNNNAAWINGGVLYKINGDAPLSNDQIRRIATSM